MKFRAIVEYEYPIEHKPPVKAELILHGDRVVTDSIEPLPQEPFINKPCVSEKQCEHDKNVVLDKVRAEMLEEMLSHSGTGEEVIQAYVDGLKKGLDILDKYKAESKPQESEE